MKIFASLTLLLLSGFVLIAQSGNIKAKRAAPKEVPDIRYDSIILQRVGMEYIQALDSSTKKLIWKKKIYHVTYNPNKESDVQDVFIDSMYLVGKNLIIRNEKHQWYRLNLQTLTTKNLTKPNLE